MALIVSSTTDTQEQVNEAAGVETVEVEEQEQPQEQAQRPPKVPPEPAEPDEEGEEQPDEEQPPAPKKTGGFQRKIERLQQKVAELEMERRYAALHQQQQPPQQQQRPANAEPKQEEFQDYETYDNARIEYRVAQALNAREKQMEQQRAQQREQEQVQGWHERVGQFRNEVQDFDDVLGNVDHIEIPKALQQAIIEDELGPKLAYELARQPDHFEKIAKLSPLGAIKALGEFKASLNAVKAAPPRKPVSNAPEPIRPVANGANGTVHKSLDQLPLRDYIKLRNKQEADARRNQ